MNTPTRDKYWPFGPEEDGGVGSEPTSRANSWEPWPYPQTGDTGIGSPVASRPDAFDGLGGAGHGVPPLWL